MEQRRRRRRVDPAAELQVEVQVMLVTESQQYTVRHWLAACLLNLSDSDGPGPDGPGQSDWQH